MITVAVTQRVEVVTGYGERRDCLDQAWARFFATCGLVPRLVSNVPEVALSQCDGVGGIVLTGGNDLADLGGDAPERDATERLLLEYAAARMLPVIGVCRGMQLIQHLAGVPLHPVEGHVARRQFNDIGGVAREVNSYHRIGATETRAPLAVWARAADGVVKAVRHEQLPVTGIMWHPERLAPFADDDVALFRRVFGVS
jgi:putative glutamine amidotransferase